MFGCSVSELHRFVLDSIGEGRTYEDRAAAAFCMLSDAQEAYEAGAAELGRQAINRAKWLLKGADRRRDEQGAPTVGPFAGIERRG